MGSEAVIIHSAKSDKEISGIIVALDDLINIYIERYDWIEIGKYQNKLKKKGITVPYRLY